MPSETSDTLAQPYVGRVISLKKLPGWADKWLEVPVGWQGVVVDANGYSRILRPGKHIVLNAWQHLVGKATGTGMQLALVMSQPFSALLETSHLLSADGELLDASLLATLDVVEPVKLLQNTALTQDGSLLLPVSMLDVQTGLQPLAAQYNGADLHSGMLAEQLAGEICQRLGAQLSAAGLRLRAVTLLTFWPSAQSASIAEKVQLLGERLQDLELQRRMAKIETQAQLDDFINQVQPELAKIGLHSTEPEPQVPKTPQADMFGLGTVFRSWLELASARQSRQKPALVQGATATHLHNPTVAERTQVDRALRQQVSDELALVHDSLVYMHKHINQAGVEDLAVQLTRLEDNVEGLVAQVQSTTFGRPLYLDDIQTSWADWQCMLEYDERLLLYVKGLGEKVHQLQQNQAGAELKPAILADLEQELDHFTSQFSGRSRSLQA
jgi:hypothetical protein